MKNYPCNRLLSATQKFIKKISGKKYLLSYRKIF